MSELLQLETTYREVLSMDVSALNEDILSSLRYPLVAIGSGGSLSVAHFACYLHQLASGLLAKPITPLELISWLNEPGSRHSLINSAVMCLTAGGSNADINSAWRSLIKSEPRQVTGICAKKHSPLAKEGEKYDYVRVFDFDLPSKKDGFLATNSLLAFLVLMGRTYGPLINGSLSLPPTLWDLLPKYQDIDTAFDALRPVFIPILERDYLTVLYSGGMEVVACDIESKLTEAALNSVQTSDFRNFAHGRHHWLAKRGMQSAVIAFANDRDIELAKKTVQLIPSSIPSAVLHFPGDMITSVISAVLTGFFLTGIAGEVRELDPGRPGVPHFGRKLYHLGIPSRETSSQNQKAPVRRKLDMCSEVPPQLMQKSYNSYIRTLSNTTFSGLVLDYDGTLCGSENRFSTLDSKIAQELIRLLRASIPLGIATGRGKSVRKSLQESIPQEFWKQIIVGYYNGAECAPLYENISPNRTNNACSALESTAISLCSDPSVTSLANVTVRKNQISVEPKFTYHLDVLWEIVGTHISRTQGITMVHSGHSIDILVFGVTKRNVVKAITALSGDLVVPSVLCIGDQGRWPGNDFDLLSEKYSLSVDSVSPEFKSCWHIAPEGYRGPQATLYYLQCMTPQKAGFGFKYSSRKRGCK